MSSSHVGGINFMDPVSMWKAHKKLMTQVKHEAIHISNKYKVQLEPFYFRWERFIPSSEKEFLQLLNEMLRHNSQQQQQPLNLNIKKIDTM